MDYPTLPALDPDLAKSCKNKLLQEEMSYDCNLLREENKRLYPLLNIRQRQVYDAVLHSMENGDGDLFFVYVFMDMGAMVKHFYGIPSVQGKIVLTVASSGIASLLIDGGRTAHSRFKISIDIEETSSCDVKQKTYLAELLSKTTLVIWDEAPMCHRFIFEAVDRTVRDIIRKVDPFAESKSFGGDFRQIFLVLPKKGR